MDSERTLDPSSARRAGADVDAGVGSARTDAASTSTLSGDVGGMGSAAAADGASFIRREERLRTDTVRVPVERVRLVKRVVVEQVTRTVEVRREELHVETLPVEGGAGGPGGAAGGPTQPFEMVLHEEQVEMVKRLVPRERVRVSVERIGEQHTVGAELRSEQVVVEPIGSIQPVD